MRIETQLHVTKLHQMSQLLSCIKVVQFTEQLFQLFIADDDFDFQIAQFLIVFYDYIILLWTNRQTNRQTDRLIE